MCRAVKDEVGNADRTHLVWTSYSTVRNLDFMGNGEPLDAFKPKQVNNTVNSVCVRVCFFSFSDYKCSSWRMKGRKKEAANR